MTGSKDRPIWREPAVIIGVILTAFTVGYFWYSFSQNPVSGEVRGYPNKFTYLQFARPNEIGDTLAGLAGSLALIWIVVTVWLQATELKEQRLEIREQREATQDMARAQAKQVELLEIQGEIFKDEQRQRLEMQAHELLEQRIKGIRALFVAQPLKMAAHWKTPSGTKQPTEINIKPNANYAEDLDIFLSRLSRILSGQQQNIVENEQRGFELVERQFDEERANKLLTLFEEIVGSQMDLSAADAQRVKNCEVGQTYRIFASIFRCEKNP